MNRPNRQMRRRRGKTDTVDAEAAARAALNGSAAVVPKSADGCVEAIRTLRVARRSAVKARTVAANQIDAVVVTAPEPVKDRLRALNTARTVEACARMRPGTDGDLVRSAAKRALRSLARRHQALTAEIKHLDAELRRLCERANPALLGACGVGAETAAALLVAAGDNPERLRSEASFAALCGTSPIEASSGRTVRHRLNRGGNRQANNALWRIAMVRLRVDERSIAYAARLTAEGKTRREILRCLKRHIAREVYKLIIDPPDVAHGADLRRHRTQRGLTIHQTARALGAAPNRYPNSKEASSTTATSPNATSDTSHRPGVDKHRSIHRWSSPTYDCAAGRSLSRRIRGRHGVVLRRRRNLLRRGSCRTRRLLHGVRPEHR